MSYQQQSGTSNRTLPGPTPDEGRLTGLSVQEKELQLENLRRQQQFQELLQSIATGEGGLFDEAATAGIKAGSFDIDTATREGLGLLREELAPSLGLRSTDSPILDRGNLLARRGIAAKSSLENTLRAKALENRLALLSTSAASGLGLAGVGSGNSALAALSNVRLGQGTTNTSGSGFGLGLSDVGSLASGVGSLYSSGALAAL